MSNMQLAAQLKRKVNYLNLPETGIDCHHNKVGIPKKKSRNYKLRYVKTKKNKHAKQPSLDNFTKVDIDLPHLSSQ